MSESLVVAKHHGVLLSDSGWRLACDSETGRAEPARARSIGHDALDLARARGGERRNARDQRLVGARARQRKTEAAQYGAVAVEDRRTDADAAGIDLAMRHADAGSPQVSERAAELIEAVAEPGRGDLV